MSDCQQTELVLAIVHNISTVLVMVVTIFYAHKTGKNRQRKKGEV